jgi:hypothetical protein
LQSCSYGAGAATTYHYAALGIGYLLTCSRYTYPPARSKHHRPSLLSALASLNGPYTHKWYPIQSSIGYLLIAIKTKISVNDKATTIFSHYGVSNPLNHLRHHRIA